MHHTHGAPTLNMGKRRGEPLLRLTPRTTASSSSARLPPLEVGRGAWAAGAGKPPRAKLRKLGAASRACGLGWLGCRFLARGASRAGVLGLGCRRGAVGLA